MTVNSSLLLLEVKSEEHFSSSQLFCSQMIQNFASEACNPLTLFGLAFGGAIARTVELSCFRSLTALSKASGFGFSSTISYFSSFVGVTTEAGFFAGMPMLEKGGSCSEFGIGTAHGTLVIGLSRIVGRYTHSSFLIHCLAQDSVVVGVDIAFETCDLREMQAISGVERFVHARAVAFQMHIGGQISHHLPGVAQNQARFALEKQMNLPSASKRSLHSWFPRFNSGKELVTSTGEVIPEDFLTTEIQNAEKAKRSHLTFMASSEEGRSNALQNHPLSDQFKDLMELSKGGDNNAIETLRQFIVESEDDAVVKLASTALGGAATDPDAYAVLEDLANSGKIYSFHCQKALNSSRYSGGLFGIDLRDYQTADIAELIEVIEKGKDRHLKRNPWQTGKSITIGPTWDAEK